MENEPEVPCVFGTRAQLEEAADSIAERAPELLCYTVYLYFIARYLVVVYETRVAELPVQVWNEYRNAFDHYIREVTRESGDSTNHMKKMEGHVQRAVLDLCKLLCHKGLDELKAGVTAERQDALRMVDNGRFLPEWHAQRELAEKQFQSAKMKDLSLGDDARNNRAVLSTYLDAFYATEAALQLWASKRPDIQAATTHVSNITAHAAHQASTTHVRDSLVAKGIWLMAGLACLFVVNMVVATDGTMAAKLVGWAAALSRLGHWVTGLAS